MDAQGRIVTSNGFPIEPEIAITEEDALDISISSDGTVTILIAGQSEPAEKDSFELVRFVNNAGLKSIGQNLFTATAASGDPIVGTPGLDGFGTLSQNFLKCPTSR